LSRRAEQIPISGVNLVGCVDAMKRTGWALVGIGAVVAVAAKRARRARKAYADAVASGSKPIEAVGTAVAAFVGLP
jgi:hypothetical protein